MNRKIGMYSAAVNAASVLAFAVFMLTGCTHGCYFASMFIAFSFVPMMCAYAGAAAEKRKTAGLYRRCFLRGICGRDTACVLRTAYDGALRRTD